MFLRISSRGPYRAPSVQDTRSSALGVCTTHADNDRKAAAGHRGQGQCGTQTEPRPEEVRLLTTNALVAYEGNQPAHSIFFMRWFPEPGHNPIR